MGNSYNNAQSQNIGMFNDSTAGFMRIGSLARELSKVVPRYNANATEALVAVSKRTKVSMERMFGKVIRADKTWVLLYISEGRTSDEATNNEYLYYVKIHTSTLALGSTKKIKNPLLALQAKRNEIEAKQKKDAISQGLTTKYESVSYGASIGYSRPSSNSIHFRKYRREPSQMSNSYPVQNIPEQMQIDMVGLEIIPTLETSFEVEAKDFASSLQSASQDIYTEILPAETVPVPGTSKFTALGISPDSPAIICSTRPNRDLVTDGKVFQDIVAERFVKLESVYNILSQLHDSPEFEAAKELYDTRVAQTKDLFSVLEEINNVELAIKETVKGDASDELRAMDFPSDQIPTAAFLQAVYDLGAFPFIGGLPFRRNFTSQSTRNLTQNGLGISGHSSEYYTTSIKKFVENTTERPEGMTPLNSDGKRYEFFVGQKTYSLLDGHGDVNSDHLNRVGLYGDHYGGTWAIHSHQTWFDTYSYSQGGNLNTSIPSICSRIWTEMVLSKLVSAEHEIAVWCKNNNSINFGDYFLGDVTTAVPISSVEVPTKMASIAKFVTAGQTYYPFEESISILNSRRSGAPTSGRTFYENILQPALGDIIEGRDYDFSTVSEWMDQTNTQTAEFIDFLSIFMEDGGPQIIFNEIAVALLKLLTDESPFSHPISEVTNNLSDTENLDLLERARLLYGMISNIFDERQVSTLVYNTLSWCGSPKDIYNLAKQPIRAMEPNASTRNAHIESQFVEMQVEARDNTEEDKRLNPSDDSAPVQYFNTIVSMANYLFEQIEIGITNSITALLSEKGLIDPDSDFDYSAVMSGFFETSEAGGEQSACFNIPKFALRAHLWRAISELLTLDETDSNITDYNGLEAQEIFWTQIAALAVTNLDPEQGPVRYKVTRGAEPFPVSFGSLADEEFFADLIPQAIQDELAGIEAEAEAEANPVVGLSRALLKAPTFGTSTLGGGSATSTMTLSTDKTVALGTDDTDIATEEEVESAITEDWQFLTEEENYCPFTFVLEGEDSATDVKSLVFANRGAWTTLLDDFMEWRTQGVIYKNFITSVVTPFENLPNVLDSLAANEKIDAMKDVAQFPGIEGRDVILYTSKVQDFNRRKDMIVNAGNAALNYLPAKYVKTVNEYLCARMVIFETLQKFQRPETAKFHSVGIPCGLIGNLGDPFSPVNLRKHASFAFFMDFQFSELDTFFMPNIYLVPGSLADCDPQAGINSILQNAKFLLITQNSQSFIGYDEASTAVDAAFAASGKRGVSSSVILTNHLISYCIAECVEVMNGMVLNENTFRYDKDLPTTIIDGDIQGLLPDLIKNPPDNIADYFDDMRLKTTMEILSENPKMSMAEVNIIQAALESRILSSATVPASMLGVRMFDRVYHVISHPNQFHVVSQTRTGANDYGLSDLRGSDQFEGEGILKIDMEDEPHGNKLYNDHIASYAFDIEV